MLRATVLAIGCVWGFAGVAHAQDADTSATEIEDCLRRTLPERSAVQTLTLEVVDPDGEESRSRAELYWKRSESELSSALLRFSDPPRRAGMAMLVRERVDEAPETYLYLPELRQTRRVSAKSAAGSMFGTDFSYEDFAFLQGIGRERESRRGEDTEIDGVPVYVVETRPQDEASSYERILLYIEQSRCVPLRAAFYKSGEEMRKELLVGRDTIEAVGDRFVPKHFEMRDLELGTTTRVVVEKIDIEAEIRDRFLEPSQLEIGGR